MGIKDNEEVDCELIDEEGRMAKRQSYRITQRQTLGRHTERLNTDPEK